MYKGKTVGVVVPAYNEEEFVGEVLETVPEFVDRIYAIDDKSTDDTWKEIESCARELNRQREPMVHATDGGGRYPRRVIPIRHETNKGVGGAIKTGYTRAYNDGIDVVAVMAGDGQMDPNYLDTLLDPIVEGKADYAKGNRFLHPPSREEMPRHRLVGNWMLSLLTKFASGYWRIGDPQNGYTAISRDALAVLDLEALYDRYGFANELLTRLNVHDLRIADVAIPAVYGEEQSDIQYHTFVPSVSRLLLTLFLWRLKTKHLSRGRYAVPFLYLLCLVSFLTAGLMVIAPRVTRNSTTATKLTALPSVIGGIAFGGVALFERAQGTGSERRTDASSDERE